jgi:hypothetical protein
LLHRAEEHEQQHSAVEIVGSRKVTLYQQPCGRACGIHSIGNQANRHQVDNNLQFPVWPDVFSVLFRLLTGVKGSHDGKEPTGEQIHRYGDAIPIIFFFYHNNNFFFCCKNTIKSGKNNGNP